LVLVFVVTALVVVLALAATAAFAHNAGHIHLPTGECQDVGSGKHGTVDLIPGPGDQYGTRYAAEQGNTPIWPRHCDEPGAHSHP
jgi:hypothetical protein